MLDHVKFNVKAMSNIQLAEELLKLSTAHKNAENSIIAFILHESAMRLKKGTLR